MRTMKKTKVLLLMICIATCCLLVLSGCQKQEAGEQTALKIQYFYHSPCASCNEDEQFFTLLHQQLDGIVEKNRYQAVAYNTFQGDRLFTEECDRLNIDTKQRYTPMLVVGEAYVQGDQAIERELKQVVLQALGMEVAPQTEDTKQQPEEVAETLQFDESQKPFYAEQVLEDDNYFAYFYTSSCADCEKTLAFYEQLQTAANIPETTATVIAYHNILAQTNLDKIQVLFEQYAVPEKERQVPILFFKDGYLSGYQAIADNMEQVLTNGKASGVISLDGETTRPRLTLLGVMVAGFLNGLNPCSISMLLFLFSLLLSKRQSVLKLGSCYVLGKAVSYFLIGIFFYSILSVLELGVFQLINKVVNILLIVLCLVLFVLSMWDFIVSKREEYAKIKLQLPVKLRKFNHKLMERFTGHSNDTVLFGSMFILGFIISIGEFICTGQIYIATILSLFRDIDSINLYAIGMFLTYIVCMCIPFMLFTILAHKGNKILNLSEKTRAGLPYIKLVSGILFLGFAVLAFWKLK